MCEPLTVRRWTTALEPMTKDFTTFTGGHLSSGKAYSKYQSLDNDGAPEHRWISHISGFGYKYHTVLKQNQFIVDFVLFM